MTPSCPPPRASNNEGNLKPRQQDSPLHRASKPSTQTRPRSPGLQADIAVSALILTSKFLTDSHFMALFILEFLPYSFSRLQHDEVDKLDSEDEAIACQRPHCRQA